MQSTDNSYSTCVCVVEKGQGVKRVLLFEVRTADSGVEVLGVGQPWPSPQQQWVLWDRCKHPHGSGGSTVFLYFKVSMQLILLYAKACIQLQKFFNRAARGKGLCGCQPPLSQKLHEQEGYQL